LGSIRSDTGYAVNNDVGAAVTVRRLYSVDTASGSAPHFWAASVQSGSSVKTYPDARLNINKSIYVADETGGKF